MYEEDKKILDGIAASLVDAGYDPVEQLTGYVEFGNPLFITRLNNSREKITNIEKATINRYLLEYTNE